MEGGISSTLKAIFVLLHFQTMKIQLLFKGQLKHNRIVSFSKKMLSCKQGLGLAV